MDPVKRTQEKKYFGTLKFLLLFIIAMLISSINFKKIV